MPEQTERPSPWMTPPEAARYLKLSRRGLDNLVREGLLQPHRLGVKTVRFHQEELDSWAKAQ